MGSIIHRSIIHKKKKSAGMERWFMAYNLEKFKKGLDDLQIHLDEKQMRQFLTYYELLVETNKVMNLTAITEFDEVIEKHFLDSLSLCRVKDLRSLEDRPEAYRFWILERERDFREFL